MNCIFFCCLVVVSFYVCLSVCLVAACVANKDSILIDKENNGITALQVEM